MDYKKIICYLLCCLVIPRLHAQNFGAVPNDIHWRQLQSPTARIIFPNGYDSTANRIAIITEALYQHRRDSIGSFHQPVSILLHPFTTVSNGFVALAPFRSEFFLHPPSQALENGALYWPDQLALHEYRHVQQYESFNTGLSKLAGILFGENARSLANAAAVPDWFFEGDAVYNEIFYSAEGRGRLPAFLDGMQQIIQAGNPPTYAVLRNGSFKKYTPNHYQLGYVLTAYGYATYGADFWSKVSREAASFRPLFYPFQGAVKKYAGIPFKQFVQDAFRFYQDTREKDTMSTTLQWLTSTRKHDVVDYRFPYPGENGSMIVLKNSYKKIPAFFKIDKNGQEHFIQQNLISGESYFSYRAGKIITGFDVPDIRYAYKRFTGIKTIDVETGEAKTILRKAPLFTPDISPDQKQIVAIEMPSYMQTNLVVLNENGEMINRYAAEPDIYFSYPKFSADGQSVYVIIKNDQGEMGIQLINKLSGKATTILPVQKRILGNPVVQGDTLLVICAHDAEQEVWAITGTTCFKAAIHGHQVYQAMLSGKGDLVISTFTLQGYRLASVAPAWQAITAADTLRPIIIQPVLTQKENDLLENLSPQNFLTTKYNKFTHPFHFHSWNPVLDDPEYSFYLYGQDLLNIQQSQLYYTYNANEQSHTIGFSDIYGGWVLQPFLQVTQSWDRQATYRADTVFSWNESNVGVGWQLPLNFSGSRQYRALTATIAFHFNAVQWTGMAKDLLKNYNLNYLQYRLEYKAASQQARQQIYPPWAQYFSFQYVATNGGEYARQWNLNARLFLPGIVSTHSLVLSTAIQHTDSRQQYFFSNNFQPARGYTAYRLPLNAQAGATYHFPLVYPDWGFGQIVFFSRIRAAVFYDQGWGKSYTQQRFTFRSFGVEMYLDTKWWNQQPVTVGLRYSRLLDAAPFNLQPNQWEVIMPVKLFRQ